MSKQQKRRTAHLCELVLPVCLHQPQHVLKLFGLLVHRDGKVMLLRLDVRLLSLFPLVGGLKLARLLPARVV